MATPKPTAIAPKFQEGLIRYLMTASRVSLGSIRLRRLAEISDWKHEIGELLEGLATARAHELLVEAVRGYRERCGPIPEMLPAELRTDLTPLDPFFRPRREANAIRARQSISQQNSWLRYFEAYGCLKCEEKTRTYFSDGMCGRCHQLILSRRRDLPRPILRRTAHKYLAAQTAA